MINKEYFNFLKLLMHAIKQDLRLEGLLNVHKFSLHIFKSIKKTDSKYQMFNVLVDLKKIKLNKIILEKKEIEIKVFELFNDLLDKNLDVIERLNQIGILSELKKYQKEKEKKEKLNKSVNTKILDFSKFEQIFIIDGDLLLILQDEFISIDKILNGKNAKGIIKITEGEILKNFKKPINDLILQISVENDVMFTELENEKPKISNLHFLQFSKIFNLILEKQITIYENNENIINIRYQPETAFQILNKIIDEAGFMYKIILDILEGKQ